LLESRQLLSITVATFDDVVDSGDGLTSLREAIAQAAADNGADTIVLLHEIGGVEGTFALTLGELAIDDPDAQTIESTAAQPRSTLRGPAGSSPCQPGASSPWRGDLGLIEDRFKTSWL
jgi:hypothetical protein